MIAGEGFTPSGIVVADDQAMLPLGQVGVRGEDRFALSLSVDGSILLTALISEANQLGWQRPPVSSG